jgi:hypothetical protein
MYFYGKRSYGTPHANSDEPTQKIMTEPVPSQPQARQRLRRARRNNKKDAPVDRVSLKAESKIENRLAEKPAQETREQKSSCGLSQQSYSQSNTPRRNKRHPGRASKSVTLARDVVFCPICTEKFEELELRFNPCPCGYRICAMCVHLIKEKTDGKCPSCRALYSQDRESLVPEVDSALYKVLRQVTREEEHAKQKQTRAENRKPVFQNRSDGRHAHDFKPFDNRRLDRVLAAHKGFLSSAGSTKESSPVSTVLTPVPTVKLTRFSGGLSVWD